MPALIAVEPQGHAWYETIAGAVAEAGGVLVPAGEAAGLIWLGGPEPEGRALMHDGLRWVQLRSAGVDAFLAKSFIDGGCIYTSAAGAYNVTVAEHTLAMLLALSKQLGEYARQSSWRPVAEGRLLQGTTVGVIGAGGIGQAVIERLQPFGARVVAVTRSGRAVPGATANLAAADLDRLWEMVDHVVVSAPSTDATTQLVAAPQLRRLRPHAIVVNIARGTLVNTDDLAEALSAGTIGGAGLDVTDPEPLPEGHPLWTLPNVIITPHVANPRSLQAQALARRVRDNVERFARGEPLLGVVDRSAGY